MGKGCNGQELKSIITDAVRNLVKAGLYPKGLINDQGITQLAKILNITKENPVFEVDDQKLVYMYDSPHLLKSARNNLLKYSFEVDGQSSSFGHIRTLYNSFADQPYSSVCKLTPSHMNPNTWEKMNVRLAAQVLSSSVASSLRLLIKYKELPAEAEGTLKIVETFDKLFDMLNSDQFSHPNKYKMVYRGSPEQIDFLNDSYDFISRIKLIDKSNPDITDDCNLVYIDNKETNPSISKSKSSISDRTTPMMLKYNTLFSKYKNVKKGSCDHEIFIDEVKIFLTKIHVVRNNKTKTEITSKVNVCHGKSLVEEKFAQFFTLTDKKYTSDGDSIFEDIKVFLSSLRIIKRDEDVTNKVSFLEGFQTTIKAMIILFDRLKEYEFEYLYTKRINQDALENFFGVVRRSNGNCNNPTTRQFGCTFNKLVVLNIMDHVDLSNCEDDGDGILISGNFETEFPCEIDLDKNLTQDIESGMDIDDTLTVDCNFENFLDDDELFTNNESAMETENCDSNKAQECGTNNDSAMERFDNTAGSSSEVLGNNNNR